VVDVDSLARIDEVKQQQPVMKLIHRAVKRDQGRGILSSPGRSIRFKRILCKSHNLLTKKVSLGNGVRMKVAVNDLQHGR
jgi:hypothetical protein